MKKVVIICLLCIGIMSFASSTSNNNKDRDKIRSRQDALISKIEKAKGGKDFN